MLIRKQKINQGQLCGIASCVAESGGDVSIASRHDFAARLDEFLEKPDLVLKRQDDDSVVVKKAVMGNVDVVIKKHVCRNKFDMIRPARAFRNYRIASKLNELAIACEFPLAAFARKRGIFNVESFYATQYVPDSKNLKNYLKLNYAFTAGERKSVAGQIATIFAGLHEAGYWHRDAKNTNILIAKSAEGLQARLVDLDGVRRYPLGISFGLRFRAMITLGASLMPYKQVSRTDYLRGFVNYCNLTGFGRAGRKKLFRKLAARVKGRYEVRRIRYGN